MLFLSSPINLLVFLIMKDNTLNMSSIADRIREIEEEIARTQYNKATEHHIGLLKAKLARLRKELISSRRKGGGQGFEVKKSGDATVVFIGFPSVGKSTLLNALTGAKSEVGHYAFTTLKCVPGVLNYKGAKIQLLDLPGILEGAHTGVGRGREILSVARSADLILLVLDVFNPRRDVLVNELYQMGIRLDSQPPDIVISKRQTGGIVINRTVKTDLDDRLIKGVLSEYGIHNAIVTIRENITVDELIDVLVGNRVYIPSLTVLNKVDLVNEGYLNNLPFDFIPVSAESGLGIDRLKEAIYDKLDFIRVYTKPRRDKPDLDEPMMLRRGATIRDVCLKLHRDLLDNFRYALVWGKSAKHPGQKVGLNHVLEDGDIITIITTTGYVKQP